ncbi:peptide-methionine (R)-S-oxide reductase MsrB [Aestuariivivens insulae]|uniref:peptide-methionine (R)-S-oxide reductase MsrB n=1 Tax=Aestuariivivens insulae TaxID=1621988 RepID=UPI001F57E4BA|nr:peptide-methionine (R)-S-oxide reductase MsrB [Aestuariivivens insulae]
MNKIIIILSFILICNCNSSAQKQAEKSNTKYKVSKTEAEWQKQLTDLEYYVLRKAGTERAFSSPLNNNYEKGIYVCKACETPLFKSEHKFNSGTGWPSFDQEIKGNVAYASGNTNSFYGIEEHCATCGGHLGHIFNDGPKDTTGKRHCINGVAIKFIPEKDN